MTNETETVSDSENAAYEGVTAEDFQAFADSVEPVLQGIAACSLVLVFAVFFCAGIMAVQTLVRSFER